MRIAAIAAETLMPAYLGGAGGCSPGENGQSNTCDFSRGPSFLRHISSLSCASCVRCFQPLAACVLSATLAAQQPKPTIYPRTPDHPGPAWFVDVAAKAGMTNRNVNGSITNKKYIIESTGSGVAIID